MTKTIKFLCISLFLLTFPAGIFASQVTVQITGGIEKIDAYEQNDIVYFSFSQLVDILGDHISWEEVGLAARYENKNHKILFYFDSPYISINDTVKNLTHPVKFRAGHVYLPAQTFIYMFDLIRSEQISWDNDRRLIRINSEWYNITDIALSSKANGLLIEIFVTEPKKYEIYESEGNWLNVTIPGGTVNRRQVLSRRSNKLLRDMNAFQFEASAQISLRFRKGIGNYTHRFQTNPSRIQISIIDTAAAPIIYNVIDQIGPDDRIDKIIVDAGHGGRDNGAIGFRKTREKKIVLDIAKRLAKLIRKEKLFQVVMTREKDKYVPLEDRAEIANKNNGDLFVSIHANASPQRTARGFQVFFLAPANNDAARAAAQLENAPFLEEISFGFEDDGDDLSMILSDMIQTEFQVESADLAAMVDKELRKRVSKKTRARGLDQAGFVVLNRIYMPSILVEAAFLTNKNDEDLLRKKSYRQKIAEAIYAGLKRFRAKYEKKQ